MASLGRPRRDAIRRSADTLTPESCGKVLAPERLSRLSSPADQALQVGFVVRRSLRRVPGSGARARAVGAQCRRRRDNSGHYPPPRSQTNHRSPKEPPQDADATSPRPLGRPERPDTLLHLPVPKSRQSPANASRTQHSLVSLAQGHAHATINGLQVIGIPLPRTASNVTSQCHRDQPCRRRLNFQFQPPLTSSHRRRQLHW